MKKNVKASVMLMWLCWLIYACSYTGKVNYAANINEVMSFYQVDHATAGLASTFFFFACDMRAGVFRNSCIFNH